MGLKDVSELVARDELHVISEEVVFLAVLRWIKQDQETRAVQGSLMTWSSSLATSSETSFSPKETLD